MGHTQFSWALLGFIGSYKVFTWFYWVLLGFTGFSLVLLCFNLIEPNLTLPNPSRPGLGRLLQVFTGLYWVSRGFVGFYGGLQGFSRFYWVLLNFN